MRFGRNSKDESISRRMEILDLKLEISSTKILQFEDKVSRFEERIANVETSNKKLAEAMINLVNVLKGKDSAPEKSAPFKARPAVPEPFVRARPRQTLASYSPETNIEQQILDYLKNNGPATPNQLQVVLNRSREHVSRILKALSQNGKVQRRKEGKTYLYTVPTSGSPTSNDLPEKGADPA